MRWRWFRMRNLLTAGIPLVVGLVLGALLTFTLAPAHTQVVYKAGRSIAKSAPVRTFAASAPECHPTVALAWGVTESGLPDDGLATAKYQPFTLVNGQPQLPQYLALYDGQLNPATRTVSWNGEELQHVTVSAINYDGRLLWFLAAKPGQTSAVVPAYADSYGTYQVTVLGRGSEPATAQSLGQFNPRCPGQQVVRFFPQ